MYEIGPVQVAYSVNGDLEFGSWIIDTVFASNAFRQGRLLFEVRRKWP